MNFGILMIQGLVNSFGEIVMAAFAAAVKIESFAYMPAQDFSNAFSTFVALAYLTAGTLGVTGIWAAIPIGWVLADITGAVYYFRKRKALLPEAGQ